MSDVIKICALTGIINATVKEHDLMVKEGTPYEVRYKVLRHSLNLLKTQ